MAARRSSVKGDFKLRGLLRRIGQQMETELRPAMIEAANLVLETQRELIPKDSGESRDALTAFVSKTGLDAQIGIRGKKASKKFFFLRFIEFGTKGTQPGDKRTHTNKSSGQHFFGYAPDIPAQPARPFIRPSYDLNRDKIQQILSDAIDKTLDKAARSADA
jgi:HK97 gp10 family phage protein